MVWVDASGVHSGRRQIRHIFGLAISTVVLAGTAVLMAFYRGHRTFLTTRPYLSSNSTSAAYQVKHHQLAFSEGPEIPTSGYHHLKWVSRRSASLMFDQCPLPTVGYGMVFVYSVPPPSIAADEREAVYECSSSNTEISMHCINRAWTKQSNHSCEEPPQPTTPTATSTRSTTNTTTHVATAAHSLDSSGASLGMFAIVALALLGSGIIALLTTSYYFYNTTHQAREAEDSQEPELTFVSMNTANNSILRVSQHASTTILNNTTPFADLIPSDETILNDDEYTAMSPSRPELYSHLSSVKGNEKDNNSYIDHSDVSPKSPQGTERYVPPLPGILQMHGDSLSRKHLVPYSITKPQQASVTSIHKF